MPGRQLPLMLGPLLAVVDQAVHQGAGPAAAGGVDDQVGLFVEGEEVIVLIDDV